MSKIKMSQMEIQAWARARLGHTYGLPTQANIRLMLHREQASSASYVLRMQIA
jgi:hypothetical protein